MLADADVNDQWRIRVGQTLGDVTGINEGSDRPSTTHHPPYYSITRLLLEARSGLGHIFLYKVR